ncbi:hypothetical protein [Phenylobacterium sp.]|uniref:hypothetical protein n=1 Tax=Phenylobacterium sp. TaxID=1871053 RepID=UPI0025FBDE80|nr:hypothetical protein [Phenylobacterium sp.]MBX3484282.1 hypothetical protein [Phenylobacterium sp.]
MRHWALIALLPLAACGRGDRPSTAAGPPAGVSVAAAPAGTATAPAAAPPVRADLAKRTGELVNPSELQMVMLYHSLSGVPAPLDKWTEDDGRVRYAQPQDRAARRAEVRAELEAAARSVANVGRLRLSTNLDGLPYDPTYGEFRVAAFAPSSSYGFKALGEEVKVGFANGQVAQIWRVPKADAQAVMDRAGPYPNLVADALLQIVDVQPEQAGGAISANVVEYELQTRDGKTTVGRVRVAP